MRSLRAAVAFSILSVAACTTPPLPPPEPVTDASTGLFFPAYLGGLKGGPPNAIEAPSWADGLQYVYGRGKPFLLCEFQVRKPHTDSGRVHDEFLAEVQTRRKDAAPLRSSERTVVLDARPATMHVNFAGGPHAQSVLGVARVREMVLSLMVVTMEPGAEAGFDHCLGAFLEAQPPAG